MSVDLRGFTYPLEPLLRRQRWRLDASLARLGAAQKACLEMEATVRALREQHHHASREASESMTHRLEPVQYGQRLQWLAHLQAKIVDGEAQVERLKAERDHAKAACLAHQVRLDVIERHRESASSSYAQGETGRMGKVTDQDWLVRRHRQVAGERDRHE